MRRKNSNNFPIHKTFTAIFDISRQKEPLQNQREAPGAPETSLLRLYQQVIVT